MNRTLTYNITEADAGQRVSDFLKTKGFSSQNLVDLRKTTGNIFINGEYALQKRIIESGEVLTVHIIENEASENIIPVNLPLEIVYEDGDLLVINKPANMPVHPSMDNFDNTMANALAWYFEKQNKPFVFRCINRLDRDTSGLTIVAKHKLSAGILCLDVASKSVMGINAKGIKREYIAIIRGKLPESEGTIDVPIARKEGSVLERIVDFENGERAITHYKVLKEENGHSLISLELETGRTHQIRVHMKHIGHPLIGDFLYNPDMEYISRQALHSYRLSFEHPITREVMEFVAPLPEDMKKIVSMED